MLRQRSTVELPQPPPPPEGVHVTAHRSWLTDSYFQEVEVARWCTEEQARSAAYVCVQADPENCVAEVRFLFTTTGGAWSVKAFTSGADKTTAFAESGAGKSYMIYHERSRSKPGAPAPQALARPDESSGWWSAMGLR